MNVLTKENYDLWLNLRGHLERVIDNEARLFSAAELIHLEEIVFSTNKVYAATLAADFLKNSPLSGELLDIYATRLGTVIGQPIYISAEKRTPIDDHSEWVTNPTAKTFEIGW